MAIIPSTIASFTTRKHRSPLIPNATSPVVEQRVLALAWDVPVVSAADRLGYPHQLFHERGSVEVRAVARVVQAPGRWSG